MRFVQQRARLASPHQTHPDEHDRACRRLWSSVVIDALKQGRRGDRQARYWLLSDEGAGFVRALGFDPGRVLSILDDPTVKIRIRATERQKEAARIASDGLLTGGT